jgi:hypothetical protein
MGDRPGFVFSDDFGIQGFRFNELRGRRGEGPVPAKLAELVEHGLALQGKLPFTVGEEPEELGAVHEGLEGVSDAIEFGARGAGAVVGGGLDVDFEIEDAGFGGDDAGEAPVDGGEAADETELGLVDGLEAADEGLEEGVEGLLIFAAEDAGELGVAAVLEAVQSGAGLAFGSLGAARAGAVAPCGCELFFGESDERHDVIPGAIVAGGAKAGEWEKVSSC